MLKNFKFFFVFYLVLIALCFTSLFAFVSNVKADSNITLEDGAEIRTTGKEGIRFIANANDLTDYTEFGFVCAKGTYSLSEMTNAFNAAEWSSMEDLNTNTFTYESGSSNGINMIRSYQSNLESGSKEIKLTIFDINEANYLTDLSVFAYGIVNDAPVFSNIGVTRNIAEVAALAKLSGDTSELVGDVVSGVKSEYKAVEVLNEKVSVFSYSSVSSLELEDLKAEFIADVNAFCGTSLTAECTMKELANILANVSWGWNPAPAAYGQDITSGNIFKFFQNGAMRAKWSFLMEYLISNGAANTKLQAFEILDDGLYTDAQNTFGASKGLFGGDHAVSEIWLILNQSEATYAAGGGNLNKDYTDPAKYEEVKQYCKDSIAANIASLVKVGEKFILPSFEKTGYTFNGWNDGANLLAGSSEYTITKNDIVFTADLTPITYTIKYYNENDEYTELAETYTIEKSVTLPTLDNYDAYVFGGWYDNPELSGDPVETISKGTTGEKVYYAKWSLKVDTIIVDDDYASLEVGTKVTFDGVEYTVGSDAQTSIVNALAFANEGATIYVAAGTYTDAFTISKDNISIVGPNIGVDPNGESSRNEEAIINAKIKLGLKINNVTFNGLKFTNTAEIETIIATTNTNAGFLYYSGFNFLYNYVDKGADNSNFLDFNFANFTSGDIYYYKDIIIDSCYFTAPSVTDKLIYVLGNENLTVINSCFDNLGGNAIYLEDSSTGTAMRGSLLIKNNEFISVKKSAFWSNHTNIANATSTIEISKNIFNSCSTGNFACIDFEKATANSKQTIFNIYQNTFNNVYKCLYVSSLKYATFTNNLIYKYEGSEINGYIVKASASTYAVDCSKNLYLSADGNTVYTTPSSQLSGLLVNTKNGDTNNYESLDAYKEAIANLE